jgi:hypothetical protein
VEEGSTNTPTIFDIRGINPVIDAFGNLIEYNAIFRRSDVQV